MAIQSNQFRSGQAVRRQRSNPDMSKQEQALETARQHAQAVAAHLKRVRNARQDSDHTTLQSLHRAAAASLDQLNRAHDVLEASLNAPEEPAAHDPISNPTAAPGAQVSNGESPRSLDPEVRRQQDQLRSCQIAFEARQRQLRGLR